MMSTSSLTCLLGQWRSQFLSGQRTFFYDETTISHGADERGCWRS